MTLSACGASPTRTFEPTVETAKPVPTFGGRVHVSQPKAGEPLLLITARYKAGLATANQRLDAWDEWAKAQRANVEGARK